MAQYIQSNERKKTYNQDYKNILPDKIVEIEENKDFTDKQKYKTVSPINWSYKKY